MTSHYSISLFAGVVLWLSAISVSGQVLTTEGHTPCPSDSLLTYKLPYVNVTDSGRNCIWDFSDLPLDSAELITMDYFTPIGDTTLIGLHREHVNLYYRCTQDTLWWYGYETAKTDIRYSSPALLFPFPFSFGDSIKKTFTGKGQYCHFVPLSVEGTRMLKADATGCLILLKDTVDSVLRIHSVTQYREKQMRNLIQEDCYQWYSPYCRYPLFETVSLCTIQRDDTISYTSSYIFPKELERTSTHNTRQRNDSEQDTDFLITDVNYLPNPVYSDLQIKYSLIRPAQVSISLHYNGGATTYQTPVMYEVEGEHSQSVNMAGLPTGIYVVYIQADDTVVSGNIIKLY